MHSDFKIVNAKRRAYYASIMGKARQYRRSSHGYVFKELVVFFIQSNNKTLALDLHLHQQRKNVRLSYLFQSNLTWKNYLLMYQCTLSISLPTTK
jgi:hypothetical protein